MPVVLVVAGRPGMRPGDEGSGVTDMALFADGPWKGEAREIESWARVSGWMVRSAAEPLIGPWPSLSPAGLLDYDTAHYRFREYAVFGRVILVGSVAQPPSDDDLFEVLLSGAAKKSARLVPPPPTHPR